MLVVAPLLAPAATHPRQSGAPLMMSAVQRAAMIFGWILIAFGLIGFLTAPDALTANSSRAAHLFGLFPINLIRSVLHLAWGIWGLAASQWRYSSRQFAQISGVVFIALAIYGIFSTSFLGLFPIGGNDVWLDAIIGVILGYFAITSRAEVVAER
jgi:hypothetical protein